MRSRGYHTLRLCLLPGKKKKELKATLSVTFGGWYAASTIRPVSAFTISTVSDSTIPYDLTDVLMMDQYISFTYRASPYLCLP